MFDQGKITAFPTDTSWGLAVRADDQEGMDALADLKGRKEGQYFSLIVKDGEMLRDFAYIPVDFVKFVQEELGWIPDQVRDDKGEVLLGAIKYFFNERPRTAILKPTSKLPESKYWPEKSVAFRVTTLPKVAEQIKYPVTATSANFTGENSIFSAVVIRENFGNRVEVFPGFENDLAERPASEIWDFTVSPAKRLR